MKNLKRRLRNIEKKSSGALQVIRVMSEHGDLERALVESGHDRKQFSDDVIIFHTVYEPAPHQIGGVG